MRGLATAHVMIREATEDTVLTIPNPPGEEGSYSLPVEKGAQVVVDMVGVREYSWYPHRTPPHSRTLIEYNPRYLDEPEKFKPSRWYYIEYESETFTAFSIGVWNPTHFPLRCTLLMKNHRGTRLRWAQVCRD
jgi:hypothetical protein